VYDEPIDPMENYLDNLKKKLIAEHNSKWISYLIIANKGNSQKMIKMGKIALMRKWIINKIMIF